MALLQMVSSSVATRQLRLDCISLLPASSHPARRSFHSGCSSLASVSHSRGFTRSAQVLRSLTTCSQQQQPRNPTGFVIRAILNFFKAVWEFFFKGPLLLVAKRLEGKIDKATDVVEDFAKFVIQLTRAGKKVADTVEEGLENLENLANRVVEATEKIDDTVEDAVDMLENAGAVVEAQEAKIANVKQQASQLAEAASELKAAVHAQQASAESSKPTSS